MAPKKLSREECQAFLDRFNSSKLSVARFCENENISIPTFYKRRQRANSGLEKSRLSRPPIKFLPVRTAAVSEIGLREGFSLELNGSCVLKIPMQFDSESAACLIGILKEQGF